MLAAGVSVTVYKGAVYDIYVCFLYMFLRIYAEKICYVFTYDMYVCMYVCMYVHMNFHRPYVFIPVCAHLDHYYDILGGARQG